MRALEDRTHDTERDAMRYRWLRDTQNKPVRGGEDHEPAGTISNLFVSEGDGVAISPDSDELDAAVDAAMLAASPDVPFQRPAAGDAND
ncbi:hypothetical protein [Ralstonia sp. UBA689]|uniref:hypothetical protein n=1 Tax=Ralstonia sp. UBA689 TaxID=1947373 RepID=UPI0025FDBED5|nr:hypothetical protein [Ralstonia sp. UBA689]